MIGRLRALGSTLCARSVPVRRNYSPRFAQLVESRVHSPGSPRRRCILPRRCAPRSRSSLSARFRGPRRLAAVPPLISKDSPPWSASVFASDCSAGDTAVVLHVLLDCKERATPQALHPSPCAFGLQGAGIRASAVLLVDLRIFIHNNVNSRAECWQFQNRVVR